jgi:uncharacterized protein YgbK (DUF1537 family)
MPLLGCIADDFTGATDLANTLVSEGMRVVQVFGLPSEDFAIPESDVIVVALKSLLRKCSEPFRANTSRGLPNRPSVVNLRSRR